jgi:hypothetical protein
MSKFKGGTGSSDAAKIESLLNFAYSSCPFILFDRLNIGFVFFIALVKESDFKS